jgi:hypothetical protein
VPRIDPVAVAGVLCHADEDTPPAHRPSHPADCIVCPLCATLHVQPVVLAPAAPVLTPPAVLPFRVGLPPPSTGPPAPHRPTSQPRAPPTNS